MATVIAPPREMFPDHTIQRDSGNPHWTRMPRPDALDHIPGEDGLPVVGARVNAAHAGGCGRLFEGSPEPIHHTLSRLAALPEQTQVFCTHEYTLSNLRFAAAVEPDNPDINQRLAQVSQWREAGHISLPSSIGLERATNPFLRSAQPSVGARISEREGSASRSPVQVFAALRAWKDHF